MTTNPFGADGGFDMNALLQQAEAMQAQLMAAQEQLAETVVEGSVAGVTVKVSGTGDLLGIDITPGSVDGNDAESLADLGDVIVAAYRDAKGRADEAAAQALGPLAGGGLPGLGGGAPGAPGPLGF
ncbi:YbaB/EbfC family nucleoid-associated protein [Nocardioides rubriscoriae]|uniref:YbaB/EbfC family nucleoid-associated protein n=1 Tax=Nocardioides rubriscoriae TaxID=642762 RepID=UPI0011DFB8FE|nr:YbaB/EbfC family nucleoid-associated protein [Nocardioides rubriscoriae]